MPLDQASAERRRPRRPGTPPLELLQKVAHQPRRPWTKTRKSATTSGPASKIQYGLRSPDLDPRIFLLSHCTDNLWISYIENISIPISVERSQIEDFSWFQNRSFRSIFCSSFFQFNFFRFMRFNSLVEAGLAVNKDQGRPIPSHGPLGQRLRLWVSYYLHSFEPKPRPIRKTKRIFIFKWIFPTVDFLLYTVFDCNEWHVSKD